MKFYYACFAWLFMAAILGAGMLLALDGKPWLLLLGIVGFVVAVGRIGCLPPAKH